MIKTKIKFLNKVIVGKSGRNNQGKITVRSRGGAVKKSYRSIDFLRPIWYQAGRIVRMEYDPFRNVPILFINFSRLGVYFYIIKPEGLGMNTPIFSGPRSKINIGNCLPINNIPSGTIIHNLEIYKNRGAQFARAAGSFCRIIKKSKIYTIIKLRSGSIKKVANNCFAVIGKISDNVFFRREVYYGASRNRLKGWRPKVRGIAMNPIDHPHGGGKGKKSNKSISMSPWGKLIKGKKTRIVKYNEIKLKRLLYKQ